MADRSRPPPLDIHPPLLNSANPWATTAEDLEALYGCSSTGAVTTRTTLLGGFDHQPSKHQYIFFEAASHRSAQGVISNSSLNSLGYSPLALDSYLAMIRDNARSASFQPSKSFIVSVTGGPEDVSQCYRTIASAQTELAIPLAMEINLSCPNIPNAPPPAYSGESLARYLTALSDVIAASSSLPRIPFGLKTPPYTHSTEFQTLIDALLASSPGAAGAVCPVTFITATNTLGSCLVLSHTDDSPPDRRERANGAVADQSLVPSLPGSGLGGMAGAALHPLALGNVATLRRMLDAHPERLGHIQIIGVGGVLDGAGYRRMRAAGAYAVGVGTGLGLHGVEVFRQIEKDVDKNW